jgi:hypothetical protein
MRRVWKILLVLVLAAIVWGYFFTGTPMSGRKLTLSTSPVASVELTFASSHREISSSNLCAEVVQTMQKARDGGPVHLCPALGSLTIHFADGTTNRFDLMPGHRLNRLDLVDSSGLYSISAGEMFGTLERVGLLTR